MVQSIHVFAVLTIHIYVVCISITVFFMVILHCLLRLLFFLFFFYMPMCSGIAIYLHAHWNTQVFYVIREAFQQASVNSQMDLVFREAQRISTPCSRSARRPSELS